MASSTSNSPSLFPHSNPADIPRLITHHLPLHNEVYDSVPVTAPENENDPNSCSATYRSRSLPARLISSVHPSLNTHYSVFRNSARLFGERPCLGFRPYNYTKKESASFFRSISYAEVDTRKRHLGSGLLSVLQKNQFRDDSLESHRKIAAHQNSYSRYDHSDISFILSIFSANRMEWILTDLACSAYSITNTALYDTLGDSVTLHILHTTESPVIVCSKDKISAVLQLKKNAPKELQNLILVVSMDPLSKKDPLFQEARDLAIELWDLDEVESLGRQHLLPELPPNPDTLYTISFTSGTTGSNPKGVKLTHQNAVSCITFLATTTPQIKNGRAFIFLPLTHIYERGTSAFALCTGYYLGFPHLTVDNKPADAFSNLVEDLKLFKPHYFSIVPRILTKIESVIKLEIQRIGDESVRNKVSGIIEQKLAAQAESDGSTGFHNTHDVYEPYKRLRAVVGFDDLIWTQTASAPVSPNTLKYLKASLNIGISQLYGLTETFGAMTRSHNYEASPGSCGSAGVAVELKVQSKPDVGYSARDLKGELLIRGPQVFKGYFKNDEETEKVLDMKTGWFKSGDVARFDRENGRLFIIDRVKNFFKLAQGEYILPEKIENIYLSRNPMIQQLYVHGDSVRHFLVGVVGVSYETGLQFLNEHCGYNKIEILEHELVLELNQVANKTVFISLINKNVRDQINGFERLHNVWIEINPLNVERNVVTPTLKIKRGVASKFFHKVFHRLYELERSLLEPKL